MTVAWARDFNNDPRHCWERLDGTLVLAMQPDEPCDGDHDPKLIGQTEWLRFIRNFTTAAKEAGVENPFNPDDEAATRYHLLNERAVTSDDRVSYSETYVAEKNESWGLRAVFRVFLSDTPRPWARIECYDEALVGPCEHALGLTELSYGQEVTR